MPEENFKVSEILRALLDPRVEDTLTPRMLPLVQYSALGVSLYGLSWLVYWAFQQSLWLGVVHLVLVLPLGMLCVAVLFRVGLEIGLAVLELRAHVEDMREHVGELGDLPKRLSRWPALQRLAAISERRGWIVARVDSRSVSSSREP